jgi:hypothetical protein
MHFVHPNKTTALNSELIKLTKVFALVFSLAIIPLFYPGLLAQQAVKATSGA